MANSFNSSCQLSARLLFLQLRPDKTDVESELRSSHYPTTHTYIHTHTHVREKAILCSWRHPIAVLWSVGILTSSGMHWIGALSTVAFALELAQMNVSWVEKKKDPPKSCDTKNVWNPRTVETRRQRQEVMQLKPPQSPWHVSGGGEGGRGQQQMEPPFVPAGLGLRLCPTRLLWQNVDGLDQAQLRSLPGSRAWTPHLNALL